MNRSGEETSKEFKGLRQGMGKHRALNLCQILEKEFNMVGFPEKKYSHQGVEVKGRARHLSDHRAWVIS